MNTRGYADRTYIHTCMQIDRQACSQIVKHARTQSGTHTPTQTRTHAHKLARTHTHFCWLFTPYPQVKAGIVDANK